MLRYFYWAAFLGKDEIVEKFIRIGYSPYVIAYDHRNAFMAAVEGNNIATITLMR
jgi:ankyrin repeat protein